MRMTKGRQRFTAAALAAGAVLVLAPAATATHGGVHPTFRSERTYFTCGSTKVNNVNYQTGATPSWNTTAPAQSYTQGAGCGHVDGALYGTADSTPYDVVYDGTFTGNIQSMTFELHNLLLSKGRTGSTYDIGLRVSIDGTHLFGDGTTQGTQLTMTPEQSATGLTEKITFSIQKIGCVREITDASGNVVDVQADGFATENGDGQEEHSIRVTIDQWYLNRAAGWVWGASEIPGGISFNSETLASKKVSPDDPAAC